MAQNETPPAMASVVLLQMRDYARRPVAEQARLSAQMEAVLAVLLHDIPAHERIVLDGNGSAAIAVFDNPPLALDFAERALRANDAGMGLSIGIDHGAIEISDADSGTIMSGDGVATASVTATFAAKSGLLVSRNFRTALAEAMPGTESILVPAGRFSDAGLRSYQLFCVDRDACRVRCRRLKTIAAVTACVLLVAAVAIRLAVPERPRPLAPFLEQTVIPVAENLLGTLRGNP